MTIVRACQPRFVILENVRNLAGPRHAETWLTIVESLREAGYRISDQPTVFSPHLLPDRHGGAPQVRDRVFVLARRMDALLWEERIGEVLVPRQPVHGWEPSRWRIADWLDANESITDISRFLLRPQEIGWIEAWQALCDEISSDWLPGFPIWADAFKAIPDIPDRCPQWRRDFLVKNSKFYRENKRVIDRWRERDWGPLRQPLDDFPPSRRKFEWQARSVQPRRDDRDLSKLVVHLRPSGIRVKPANYLPALVAITQTSILGPKVTGGEWRRLTPPEAARLQRIPFQPFLEAGVDDSTIYRQLGNAVNVGVVEYLARTLFADAGFKPSHLKAVV
jgi:DNA (cytosine-5)-methyltransferase 1